MISFARRVAQGVRHHPLLSFLGPVWPALRKPYLRIMTFFGRAHGITVVIAGCKMRLHPAFCTQNWESVEADSYRAFAAEVRPGAVVFDIGAHIGTYTLVALNRAGPSGRVVAYEPHAFTRRYLEQHLEWNGGAEQTLVRNMCCGAASGKAQFYYLPDRAEGMNGLVPVDGFKRMIVDVTTLDDEVRVLGAAPSVIKIDVEGAEFEVLKGAEVLLKKHKPTLFVSLHPGPLAKLGVTEQDIVCWFSDRNYVCNVIARDHEVHLVANPGK